MRRREEKARREKDKKDLGSIRMVLLSLLSLKHVRSSRGRAGQTKWFRKVCIRRIRVIDRVVCSACTVRETGVGISILNYQPKMVIFSSVPFCY